MNNLEFSCIVHTGNWFLLLILRVWLAYNDDMLSIKNNTSNILQNKIISNDNFLICGIVIMTKVF